MGWGADNPPGGPLVAPAARRVDMLSGDVAPTKYFEALSEADNLCAELNTLRESQTRVQELEAENAELRRQVAEWNRCYGREMEKLDAARADIATLSAENNDIAEQLHDLDESHRITLAALAEARRGNTEPRHGQTVTP